MLREKRPCSGLTRMRSQAAAQAARTPRAPGRRIAMDPGEARDLVGPPVRLCGHVGIVVEGVEGVSVVGGPARIVLEDGP